MDPWTAAALGAGVMGMFGGGGGGGGYSRTQDRLYSAQADIADLMRRQMMDRYANVEQPYMGRAMENIFGFAEGLLDEPRDVLWAPGIFEPVLRQGGGGGQGGGGRGGFA